MFLYLARSREYPGEVREPLPQISVIFTTFFQHPASATFVLECPSSAEPTRSKSTGIVHILHQFHFRSLPHYYQHSGVREASRTTRRQHGRWGNYGPSCCIIIGEPAGNITSGTRRIMVFEFIFERTQSFAGTRWFNHQETDICFLFLFFRNAINALEGQANAFAFPKRIRNSLACLSIQFPFLDPPFLSSDFCPPDWRSPSWTWLRQPLLLESIIKGSLSSFENSLDYMRSQNNVLVWTLDDPFMGPTSAQLLHVHSPPLLGRALLSCSPAITANKPNDLSSDKSLTNCCSLLLDRLSARGFAASEYMCSLCEKHCSWPTIWSTLIRQLPLHPEPFWLDRTQRVSSFSYSL